MTNIRRVGEQANPKPASGSRSQNADVLQALSERMANHRSRRSQRPFVTLSYSQSLDGSIAARQGEPMRLSNSQSLALTHEIRSIHDAILVGIGTVLADNPRLNVRLAKGDDPQPVVVDSKLRFPLEGNVLRNSSQPPWIATTEAADAHRQRRLEEAGARVFRLSMNEDGSVDLVGLLEILGQLDIRSVMVEGGSQIITSFLNGRLVDFLVLTVAPVLVGGLPAVQSLAESKGEQYPRLVNVGSQHLGNDLVIWGDATWDRA